MILSVNFSIIDFDKYKNYKKRLKFIIGLKNFLSYFIKSLRNADVGLVFREDSGEGYKYTVILASSHKSKIVIDALVDSERDIKCIYKRVMTDSNKVLIIKGKVYSYEILQFYYRNRPDVDFINDDNKEKVFSFTFISSFRNDPKIGA